MVHKVSSYEPQNNSRISKNDEYWDAEMLS